VAFVFACELPDGLWYDVARDVWVQDLGNGHVHLGMTDPAQTRAGRILYVRARTGKRVAVGKSVATIESAKWVGPVPSPLDGEVVAHNPRVVENPNVINQDPYGAWLVELAPTTLALEESGLLRGESAVAAYREKLHAEGLTCLRCADENSSSHSREEA
jgi:glycine cleavage system H protein